MNPRSSGRLLVAALALIAALPGTRAQTIYKCAAANGDVTYQDHACAAGAKQTAELIVAPAPAHQEPIPFDKLPAATAASEPVPRTVPPPAEPAKPPVPPIWFCTRPDDGSHYVSRDGQPPTRWIPGGILGVPQRSLAQNYGPGGGAGVSAPGMNKPKIAHNRPDNIAGDYIEVEDECTQASEQQACDYFQNELDNVEHRLRRAFKDERATLEPEQAQLRRDLEGC